MVQRILLVVMVVGVVLAGRRMIPPSVGFLPRVFLLTGLVVVALWLVSYTIKYFQARQQQR